MGSASKTDLPSAIITMTPAAGSQQWPKRKIACVALAIFALISVGCQEKSPMLLN
jgi:hypothetical protein